ncbi:MAG: reverse transcriptase [Muribaculaceae bacterium]|nr:reverse transcriptase [Muribaculaceae bacterium]
MKRTGNLIERIADCDNLHLAFIKSCRGKQCKAEVIRFRERYDDNIRSIRDALLAGNVAVGDYNYFTIHDPKERLICAASFRERVLHHAIMNVCHDIFDRSLIYDTYATRRGKGVYAALDRAVKGASRYRYMVKLDYRKYFDSIDHEILKRQLSRLFKDKGLLTLLASVVDSYSTVPGKGVPIGNLTSQYFANHYLSGLDHRMKECVRVPVYIRYMDDVLMMDDDRMRLRDAVGEMTGYSETELSLRLKTPVYRCCDNGMPFLGYVVRPHCLTLSGRSKRRFRKKIESCRVKYETGELGEGEYASHLLPLLAFVRHARCRKFRETCIVR